MNTRKKKMLSKPTTIYDVATLAGVSISTVSLVLNTPTRVSVKTRKKVLKAVDALGFVPKTDAVTKARRGVGRIGVIAPYTSYPTVARRLNGIFQAAGNRPFEIVVFDQESASESTSPLLSSLPITGRLDGLIVISLPLDENTAERLLKIGLPTVLVDVSHPRFDSVLASDVEGGRLAAEHLVTQGHRQFGFLGETQRSQMYVSPTQQRLRGYQDALRESGYILPDSHIRFAENNIASACLTAKELLSNENRPTAIFASFDLLAAGTLKAACELALTVPGDAAVVGFDDGDLAEALNLTTVRQPLEESGLAGMERLIHQIKKPGPIRKVALQLELIHRGTS